MRYSIGVGVIALLALAGAGCGDDTTMSVGGADLSVASDMTVCAGGPVTGALDAHCIFDGGFGFVTADPAQCSPDGGGGTGGGTFGATMYNTLGNDDDCKYTVSYSVTGGICRGVDTFFVVTLHDSILSQPVAGADHVLAEIFRASDGTTVDTSASSTSEIAPGVYQLGPLRFPAAGRYTVRFHFFESCADTPRSPHGHAAFFVDVP